MFTFRKEQKTMPWTNRLLIYHCCSVGGKQLGSQNLNSYGSCLLSSITRTKETVLVKPSAHFGYFLYYYNWDKLFSLTFRIRED